MSVLELIAYASHAEASVLCKILRKLRIIFMKIVRAFYIVNVFMSPRFQLNVKCTFYQNRTINSSRFSIFLVINKCRNFSFFKTYLAIVLIMVQLRIRNFFFWPVIQPKFF